MSVNKSDMSSTMNSIKFDNAILTLENVPFCIYLICACLLVLKMMAVTLFTVYKRFQHQAFISEEDAKWREGQVVVDESVERIRRAHQNDVENVPIFLAAAFAYLWTHPYGWLAGILFFGFTILRTLHTIVYTLIVLPQPTRAMLWLGGFLITGYMAIHSALHAFIHLVS